MGPIATEASIPAMPLALVVGEALVDVVASGEPDDAAQATPGGSPANVAVGLARLGVPTELVTRLGTDPHGNQLAVHLLDNGVQLAAGSIEPGFRTSTATATLDSRGIASYDFDLSWEPPGPTLSQGCRVVHTG